MNVKRAYKKTAYNKEIAGKRYGDFLQGNRKRWAITLEQLSDGLCTVSTLGAVENGKEIPGRLLRERLLMRAGVAVDAYESYLGREEYEEWELQQEILVLLEQNKFGHMTDALTRYAEKYNLVNGPWTEESGERLRKQFYLGMRGFCRKQQGAAPEELEEIFGRAVRLTVPEINERPMKGRVLCPQEINLILEYIQCLPPCTAIQKYRELQTYLQTIWTEDDSKAQNYPKAVLFLCCALQKQGSADIEKYTEIIKLCDSAVELLRKTKRLYYLQELLTLKEAAVRGIRQFYCSQKEPKKRDALSEMLAETETHRTLFEELYERFHVPEERWKDGYLYYGQSVYCIGDVVRIRRKMLKMTQKELCEDICSLDTLRRLEGRKKSTHPAILWELCERLGLSPECERTELVTADPRARTLEKEIRRTANDGRLEENLTQLEELKERIDTSNKINRQWLLYNEGFAKYHLGQLSREEYGIWLMQALECTLSISILELSDEQECYLTDSEMACIYHIALWDQEEDLQRAYNRMRLVYRIEQEFEEQERTRTHVCTYELYMGHRAALLYQQKEYELSWQYANHIIQLCLYTGRMNLLDSALYDWMRTAKVYAKKGNPELAGYNWKKDLERCLLLSRFYKNTPVYKFFK